MKDGEVAAGIVMEILDIVQEQRDMLEKVSKIQQEQARLICNLQQEIENLKQRLGYPEGERKIVY